MSFAVRTPATIGPCDRAVIPPTRRTLICTAEPFGYGPSSALAQIVEWIGCLREDVSACYLGQAHTLDVHAGMSVYGGRVEDCAIGTAAGRATFVDRCRGAAAVLTSCDFDAAAAARSADTPFAIYDPLTWYWPEIPPIARHAELYLCQDFFGVRERLAREGFDNAIVVPPLTPAISLDPTQARAGIVISLGGVGNPYFSHHDCVDYAASILGALRIGLAGRGPILSLTSKRLAASLPGLDATTLAPAAVHARLARAALAFLTPGLGQIYEASALGVRVVWLPPANDSQGRQLALLRRHGLAPHAIDWHDLDGGPALDYDAPQPRVLAELRDRIERLAGDGAVRARLAEVVAVQAGAAMQGPIALARLVEERGRDGAEVVGRIVDRWLRTRASIPTLPRLELAVDTPPPFPAVRPLTVPRQNVAGPEIVEQVRALHEEIDGTGFHTLAAALEVARAVREVAPRPTAADFAAVTAELRLTGSMLYGKYGAAHCTGLAEVLAARLQRELGLTGRILCVRRADSKIPLELDWQYDGTVHTDLLVPYVDPGGGPVRAIHVVTGLGIDASFHAFDDPQAWIAHLRELRYTLFEVVDPAELTRRAFGCKNRLWIVKGPRIGDDSEKLGVDVITGQLFLSAAAAASYRGPRPSDAGERVSFALAAVPVEALVALGEQFAQPDDFATNLAFLGRNLDAYCDALLCEPGRGMRRALGHP